MVLEREQDETVGVLLQKRLVGLGSLDGGDGRLLGLFLLGVGQVELLDGRVNLEGLNGRSRLRGKDALARAKRGKDREMTRHTALEGVTLAAIGTVEMGNGKCGKW